MMLSTSRNTVGQKGYPAVDVARVVMAVFMLSSHQPFLLQGSLENFVVNQWIIRVGVLFFFLCNGFFVFRVPATNLKARVLRQIKKLLFLYMIWTLIYSPFIIKAIIKSENPLLTLLEKTLSFLLNSYLHLWYLPAVTIAIAILLWLQERKTSWTKILVLAFVLYSVGVFLQSYSVFWAGPFMMRFPGSEPLIELAVTNAALSRNGFFFGFPIVALGAWIATLSQLPNRGICKLGFMAAMGLGAFELWRIQSARGFDYMHYDMYFFLPIASAMLFCLLLQCNYRRDYDTRKFRQFASLFYVLHMWPVKVTRFFFGNLLNPALVASRIFPVLCWSCGLILSASLCVIILNLSEKPRWKWLNKLY